jgi:hypothetical protein
MKKIILLSATFLLFALTSFSQSKKDSLVKMMAKDVCDELSKKDISSKTKKDLEAELGMAMIPAFTKYLDQAKAVWGFDEIDQESGYTMGKEIGMQLAMDCPAFMKIFMNNTEAVKEIAEKNKTKDHKISGTLLKINAGEISYLEVKDAAGKIEKMWWLEYFDGSNDLINEPSKLLNKKLTITYTEKEVYKATLKDYSKIKVITGIKVD